MGYLLRDGGHVHPEPLRSLLQLFNVHLQEQRDDAFTWFSVTRRLKRSISEHLQQLYCSQQHLFTQQRVVIHISCKLRDQLNIKVKSNNGPGAEPSPWKPNLKDTSKVQLEQSCCCLTWAGPKLHTHRPDKTTCSSYLAALRAFLLSADAGRLKRSALFCNLCSEKDGGSEEAAPL